jgi:hypothetical protein
MLFMSAMIPYTSQEQFVIQEKDRFSMESNTESRTRPQNRSNHNAVTERKFNFPFSQTEVCIS